MRSVFMSNRDRRPFIPCMSSRPGGLQLKHTDAASPSLYIRKRGEGELVVRAAFADATLIRPAVMFGPDDAFLTIILKLLRRLPIYPMFGRGLTRLQPAYVGDVAEATARVLQGTEPHAITYECGSSRLLLQGISQSRCTPGRP
jgi:uncharacterized protein YbjT (DUF2867 family)